MTNTAYNSTHKKTKSTRHYPSEAYLPAKAEIELYGHFHIPNEHSWNANGEINLEYLKIYGKVAKVAEDVRRHIERYKEPTQPPNLYQPIVPTIITIQTETIITSIK